jgi:hypothetical protein
MASDQLTRRDVGKKGPGYQGPPKIQRKVLSKNILITISKHSELVIFGGPLPKYRFSAISATVFHANLIIGNIWPRVDEPLCLGFMVF